ncbi:MAG: sulfatase [Gemmatimonadota bacterium]|nr:sulfatase [Gemmatimonadota bacterium]
MNRFPRSLLSVLALVAMGNAGVAAGQAPPTNVVLIIVDDLGWRDLGITGSTLYSTPVIDRLAREGTRFSRFYSASPVCSPTRASLMTGRNPARLGITNWIGGEQQGQLRQADYERALPLDERTIGEAFRDRGYVTGYIGKWHLGTDQFMPSHQGFDTIIAVNNAGQPGSYFPPYGRVGAPTAVPDLTGDPPEAYLTDRLTDAAVRFIAARRREPFLLVLAHYTVHTPLEAPAALVAAYEEEIGTAGSMPTTDPIAERTATTRSRQDHAVYAAMVETLDRGIGRITDTLRTLGLDDRTAVVFVSDNGGLSTIQGSRPGPTSNLPLRAGKGWLYEGGIRIPLIVRWPGVTQPGLVLGTPATTDDLFPTLLDLAGIARSTDVPLDGLSLAPLFRGDSLPSRPLFWHFPHYHGSGNHPSGAVRDGNYKLLEWFEDGRVELYDLAADSTETNDVSDTQPEVAERLLALLHNWRAQIGARMPKPNPDWPR